jgi:hypothetical protein
MIEFVLLQEVQERVVMIAADADAVERRRHFPDQMADHATGVRTTIDKIADTNDDRRLSDMLHPIRNPPFGVDQQIQASMYVADRENIGDTLRGDGNAAAALQRLGLLLP